MERPGGRTLVAVLVAADGSALAAGLSLALLGRFAVPGWPGAREPNAATLGVTVLLIPLCVALLAVWGLYRTEELFTGHREYQRAAHACTYATFAVLIASFLLDLDLSRGALLLAWLLCCLFVCAQRFAVRRIVGGLRRAGRLLRRALVVGGDAHAVTIAQQLAQPGSGWHVLGFLDDYASISTELAPGLRILGDPASAMRLVDELRATDLVVVPHAVSWEAQRDLLERAATADRPLIHLAPGFYHLLATGARPVDGQPVSLVTVERLRITGLDATLKHALDYALALLMLPALLALLAFLRVAGALSGGRTVLERRPALGLRGRPFELLALAPTRAVARGRLGKLPSVLNVLAGHMSFVGPRAMPAGDGALDRPWARTLLLVRPGLTGPRLADGANFEQQALRDVAYVRRYSLWLDLGLLVQSLFRLLRREPPLPPAYPLLAVEREAAVEASPGR